MYFSPLIVDARLCLNLTRSEPTPFRTRRFVFRCVELDGQDSNLDIAEESHPKLAVLDR